MKVLIIKPSSLGDIIQSLPVLKALRDTFPVINIEWVISRNLKDILEGNPLVDRLIVFDKDSWKRLKNIPETIKETAMLIKTLRAGHYDMVLDLQGLLRSGFMTFLVSSPLKVGFENAREGSRLFYNRKVLADRAIHAVDRYLEIAKAAGAKAEEIGFSLYIDELARGKIKSLIGGLRKYIVIVPSARWKTKRWPMGRFSALISRLSFPCVITGSDADRKTVQQVADSADGNVINLCGRTGLKELTALIAGAKAIVSNDSGPMHIGAALGVPVIALFGPTDPEKTGPYGWNHSKDLKVIKTSVSCSPCFKKKCRDPVCMSEISVETVLEELKEYL